MDDQRKKAEIAQLIEESVTIRGADKPRRTGTNARASIAVNGSHNITAGRDVVQTTIVVPGCISPAQRKRLRRYLSLMIQRELAHATRARCE